MMRELPLPRWMINPQGLQLPPLPTPPWAVPEDGLRRKLRRKGVPEKLITLAEKMAEKWATEVSK